MANTRQPGIRARARSARAKLDRLRDALQDGLDDQTRKLLDSQTKLWSLVQGQVLEQEMRELEAAKRGKQGGGRTCSSARSRRV